MSKEQLSQAQIPPSSAIELPAITDFDSWFTYPVKIQPHHTDYTGVAWHGSYINWMEEARIECLRSIGIDYVDLVALGCDLPVVELSLSYHRAIQLGMTVLVKTRMTDVTGVRLNWDYAIVSTDGEQLFTTAKVTLVALDRERGKIMRQLPTSVQDALAKVSWSKS
jgi:acyl-CoA thioester hydrolase